MKYFVFDLDGTLTVLSNKRKELMRQKKWDEFHVACDTDKVNTPIAAIYQALVIAGHKPLIVTGRNEKARELTEIWLKKNNLFIEGNLFMRPENDHRPDTIVKPELLDPKSIKIVFEDRQQMVEKWKALGVSVAQIFSKK